MATVDVSVSLASLGPAVSTPAFQPFQLFPARSHPCGAEVTAASPSVPAARTGTEKGTTVPEPSVTASWPKCASVAAGIVGHIEPCDVSAPRGLSSYAEQSGNRNIATRGLGSTDMIKKDTAGDEFGHNELEVESKVPEAGTTSLQLGSTAEQLRYSGSEGHGAVVFEFNPQNGGNLIELTAPSVNVVSDAPLCASSLHVPKSLSAACSRDALEVSTTISAPNDRTEATALDRSEVGSFGSGRRPQGTMNASFSLEPNKPSSHVGLPISAAVTDHQNAQNQQEVPDGVAVERVSNGGVLLAMPTSSSAKPMEKDDAEETSPPRERDSSVVTAAVTTAVTSPSMITVPVDEPEKHFWISEVMPAVLSTEKRATERTAIATEDVVAVRSNRATEHCSLPGAREEYRFKYWRMKLFSKVWDRRVGGYTWLTTVAHQPRVHLLSPINIIACNYCYRSRREQKSIAQLPLRELNHLAPTSLLHPSENA